MVMKPTHCNHIKLNINQMEEKLPIDIDSLRSKRLIDLTTDELISIVRCTISGLESTSEDSKRPKHLLHGLKEMAAWLHVSVPTISRMVRRGDLRPPAVVKIQRTVLFDTEEAMMQLQEIDSKWLKKRG